MNSPAAPETAVKLSVPQTHSPFPVSNRAVLDICSYTKQHSKGLLTPCRQVGLSRKSPRNSVSPSRIDVHPSSTPKRLRLVPSLRYSKGLGKSNVNVLVTNTREEETSEILGKRINLENINEKAKQYKNETEELICNKRDLGTEEEKQTGNFNNNSHQSSISALSCTVSDMKSDLNYDRKMTSPENVDGEMSTEKTHMGNLIDTRECGVDIISCKNSGFESISLNDANNVIISMGTNSGRAIKANQVKNLDTPTQQFHVHTPSHTGSKFLNNSSNEDSMTKSGSMTECTEENFKILKQQITVKEEEVKRLKLILLYKKKACNKSSAHIFTKVGEEITIFQWNVFIRAHSELLETCKHTLYFFEIHFKHDVHELAMEIARWKEGCQEALRRLHKASILQGYQLSMTRLLETFGIAPEIVGYNADTENFD